MNLDYKNKNLRIEDRVEDLLSKMSVEEKLQQLHCYGCIYTIDEEMEFIKNNIDKIDTEFYSYKGFSLSQIKAIQKFKRESTRLGIPSFISSECVHGAPLPFTTIFPTNGALAAGFDLSLADRVHHLEGKELKKLGFNRVYSPNVDLLRDPRWGRCGEGYGEDPYLNGLFGASAVKGFQAEGIEATIKHYIAYSTPEGGLNLGTAHLGEREIREYFLPPFEKCIKEGAMGVMNCYNDIDGVPGGVNPLWTVKVLREELGFNGDFITDYGLGGLLFNIHDVCKKSEKELGKIFIDAKIDIEACGMDAYGSYMKEMIENGEVDIKPIDDSVRRILTNKFKLGLFDEDYVDDTFDPSTLITKEALDLTYEVESNGAVLLKNDSNTLPLKKDTHILLVGPNAMIAQLGGIVYYDLVDDYKYKDVCASNRAIKTHEAFISKFGTSNVKVLPCCNFMSVEENQLKEAISLASTWADVIVFAGGNNAVGYSGGENGGANNPIELPDACTSNEGYDTDDIGITPSQKKVFDALKDTKAKMVFLVYEGKPCSLTDELPFIDALLYCFGVGMEGNKAICDILDGTVNPSGKLTFTIPRNVGQIPVYYNHKPLRGLYNNPGSLTKAGQDYVFNTKEPLFNFGDGLSYTTFSYSNLDVEKIDEEYKVCVNVKNTGNVFGKEAVLCYTRSLSNILVTPMIKKLRAFTKISLEPNEEKTVTFTLTKEDFSYIGVDMKKTYPTGKVKVIIKDLEKEFII